MLFCKKVQNLTDNEKLVVVLFGNTDCGVCISVKNKLEKEILPNYSNLKYVYIDISQQPQVSATYNVFVVPTLIIFAEGKETRRFARIFSFTEIINNIDRLISIMS